MRYELLSRTEEVSVVSGVDSLDTVLQDEVKDIHDSDEGVTRLS